MNKPSLRHWSYFPLSKQWNSPLFYLHNTVVCIKNATFDHYGCPVSRRYSIEIFRQSLHSELFHLDRAKIIYVWYELLSPSSVRPEMGMRPTNIKCKESIEISRWTMTRLRLRWLSPRVRVWRVSRLRASDNIESYMSGGLSYTSPITNLVH